MTRNGFRNLFARGALEGGLGMILGGLCVLAACGIIRYYWGTSAAKAKTRASRIRPPPSGDGSVGRFVPGCRPQRVGHPRPRADS